MLDKQILHVSKLTNQEELCNSNDKFLSFHVYLRGPNQKCDRDFDMPVAEGIVICMDKLGNTYLGVGGVS